MKLHIDFETYCEVSLRDVGAAVYVRHPSFCVTAVAWAFDDKPVQSMLYPATLQLPPRVELHVRGGGTICAHNAAFERNVLLGHYGLRTEPEQWDCTMQRCYVWGLPAALLEAGEALGLSVLKDETERSLMLSMSRPRKKGLQPFHQCDPIRLGRLEAYCKQDVEAERALDEAIPPLSDFERRVSLLDTRSNAMGVEIDLKAVTALRAEAARVVIDINREAFLLSGGAVSNPGKQTPALKAWLKMRLHHMPSLTKATVAEALADGTLPADVTRMLELRQLAAKASIAKLNKMLAVRGSDGRARGLLQYYGAGRTGRWAGRLIQVQNLPRPAKGDDPDSIIATVLAGERLDPMLWPAPLTSIASSLRGCLVAKAGHALLSLDLAQIEARVLAWLARQDDVLDTFRRGEDVYVYAAKKMGSTDRTLGKVVTLACGFGMGGPKFKDTALTYGVTLDDEAAQDAVDTWRAANPKIERLWWNTMSAALASIGIEDKTRREIINQGPLKGLQTVSGGRFQIKVVDRVMGIRKPNGEKLWYHNPRDGSRGWGHPEFTFDGVYKNGDWGPMTSYGGKLVENLTQAVARDVMADALLRIEEKFGLVPVMTIHDEAVYELPEASLWRHIQQEFERSPSWAPDLPVGSDARCSVRYGK